MRVSANTTVAKFPTIWLYCLFSSINKLGYIFTGSTSMYIRAYIQWSRQAAYQGIYSKGNQDVNPNISAATIKQSLIPVQNPIQLSITIKRDNFFSCMGNYLEK